MIEFGFVVVFMMMEWGWGGLVGGLNCGRSGCWVLLWEDWLGWGFLCMINERFGS